MIRASVTAATLVLALALAAPAAPAAADRLSVLLGSSHLGAPGQFEEINPGLFYTWETTRLDYTLGAYRNSYGKPSIAATVALPVIAWRGGDLSLFAGAAWYPGDGRTMRVHAGDLVPLAGVQVRQGHFFAQVIPMDGDLVAAVVSFGITWGLQ